MPVPSRFEILRDVENGGKSFPLPEKPIQVWTLLREEEFYKRGLVHWETAFIEDSLHDWEFYNGRFRFYGHSSAKGDKVNLVLIYEK